MKSTGRKVRSLILLFTMVFFISSYSISQPEQEDIIKEADLLLDMMEYESAIVNYLKILSQHPQQRDIRKKIGYAYFELNKTDDALKFLKEELILFPDNENTYDLLVYILYKINKLKEADDVLERLNFPAKLTEENPHIGGLASFILGMYYKEIERYDKARKYFRKALGKGHDPVKCYVQLIDIDFVRGKLESELGLKLHTILHEAFETCGYQPEFYFMNGLRYAEKSKREANFLHNAIQCFEEAGERNPYFKDALFNLACINYNYSDFEKASEYFREILGIEPENTEIKVYLDCCLKKLEKSTDKELISEQCPKMISLSREFIDKPDIEYKYQFENDASFVLENINYLGLEFIRRGKFHEALRRFRNGLKIYPESPGINFNMGTVYSWLNNLKNAEKHALIALRARDFFGRIPDKRKREIRMNRAGRIQKSTKIPLSEWNFEVALEEGNYFLDAYNSLGTIYFKKKEFNKSILAFKKVIEIYPGDAMGHYNLGCAYWAINDWKNAEKEWKDAIKYEEELKWVKERGKISEDQLDVSLIVLKRAVSFRAHKSLGTLYLEQYLPDKALKEFKKAVKLQPGDPEPYYELGKIYQDKSDLDEKYFEKAIFYYEKYLYLGGKEEAKVKKILKSLKKKN